MTIEFQINGMNFYILATIEGYRWMPPLGTGRLCDSELHAQQDAMDSIQKLIDDDNFSLIADNDYYHDQRRM